MRAVIFDLDDTLLKTAGVKWAHHKAVAKQFYNIDLTDEVLLQHWGLPFEELIAILYQNADTYENMLKANSSLEDQFQKTPQADALFAIETLLKAGREVGVVTSALRNRAKRDLSRFGFPIEEFFILQGADDDVFHKPNPRVFSRAIKLLAETKIELHEILYVGDAMMDYYAARDAGIEFMGITTGFVTKKQFEKEGAAAVASLGELLNHFKLF